jgi:hypothetical protein
MLFADRCTVCIFVVLALTLASYAAETEKEKVASREADTRPLVSLASLHVEPASIELRCARDHQSVVITASYSDGSTQDVTHLATTMLISKDSNDSIVEYVNEAFIPKRDGFARAVFSYSGHECSAEINVSGAGVQPPIRFRNEVLPSLTRAGCNTGKCHGSASGKDGFRLSLFGYDPSGDHYRLTRERSGRRIQLADPENSLVVLKAIGSVSHTGGLGAVAHDVNGTGVAWTVALLRHLVDEQGGR